jgi:hypothetical protein
MGRGLAARGGVGLQARVAGNRDASPIYGFEHWMARRERGPILGIGMPHGYGRSRLRPPQQQDPSLVRRGCWDSTARSGAADADEVRAEKPACEVRWFADAVRVVRRDRGRELTRRTRGDNDERDTQREAGPEWILRRPLTPGASWRAPDPAPGRCRIDRRGHGRSGTGLR